MKRNADKYILAIETTGPIGSVALIKVVERLFTHDSEHEIASEKYSLNESPLFEADPYKYMADANIPMRVTTTEMSHLRNLMPMTRELMADEEITGEDICAVAASVGPGSYTGIRIGVSTARALSQGWNVPCISVPTLRMFGEKCALTDSGIAAVILNARRGQVYGACYSLAVDFPSSRPKERKEVDEDAVSATIGSTITLIVEPGAYMLSDMLDRINSFVKDKSGIVFYGDGIDAYKNDELLGKRLEQYGLADESVRYQTAKMVARYALQKYQSGETCSYNKLLPDYMREAEAEQRLKDGSLARMRKEKLERLLNA